MNWDAIEELRKTRTPEEWARLPRLKCTCGQRFYREWTFQVQCRDCLSVRAYMEADNNPYIIAR